MIKLYSADFVLPITAPPIRDGAVAIDADRIIAVGARDSLTKTYPEAALDKHGDAVIMPGLVNAHSHLELTALRGYLEPEEGDFFAWLRKLTRARLEILTPDDLYVSSAWGAIEAARSGVTCLGDACDNSTHSLRALHDVGLRGVVYQEAFGPDARLAAEGFAALRDKISILRSQESARVRLGVSPHAPYTVSGPLIEAIARFALDENFPVMMHAAESEAERLFLREGRGPFADGLKTRGIEWTAPRLSTIRYLWQLGLLQTRPLLAHCITVDDDDLALIHAAGAKIAHCPKSNAKLGHGCAPFASFLEHNITVGLGSDSVASNNICDLLEEARFAVLLSRLKALQRTDRLQLAANAAQALYAVTIAGARALSLEDATGELRAGMKADLTIVSVGGAHQLPAYDPIDTLVFASSGRDVLLTVVDGKEIYREGRMLSVDEERLRIRMKEINRKLARL